MTVQRIFSRMTFTLTGCVSEVRKRIWLYAAILSSVVALYAFISLRSGHTTFITANEASNTISRKLLKNIQKNSTNIASYQQKQAQRTVNSNYQKTNGTRTTSENYDVQKSNLQETAAKKPGFAENRPALILPSKIKVVPVPKPEVAPRKFNISNNDVIVFLHIQKTGGSTFEAMITEDMLPSPYKCIPRNDENGMRRTECRNAAGKMWLFTRATTNWGCQVHPDWSFLHQCVPQYYERKQGFIPSRYFYITNLRNPYDRFVSEWLHVQRGATWIRKTNTCGYVLDAVRNQSKCHSGRPNWAGVKLQEFLDCPYNPAGNRQTWMLADLDKIGCDRLLSAPAKIIKAELVQSAKQNLMSMAFFSLTEMRNETVNGLKKVFGFRYPPTVTKRLTSAVRNEDAITEKQSEEIRQQNDMDIEVYNFARALYYRRFH